MQTPDDAARTTPDASRAGAAPQVERIAVVGAAILDRSVVPWRVLAGRRTEPAALAGLWEFPGGKVEPGENRRDALHREIREELGVQIRLLDPVPGPMQDGRWALGSRHAMDVWCAEIVEGTPRPLEDHDELRWLAPADLDSVEWASGDLPIVDALRRDVLSAAG